LGCSLGIDYVVETKDQATKAWYSGVVERAGLEGSYGNRVRIKTDITYNFQGKEYPVYTAYAHLDSIKVQVGQRVYQGQNIGEMGGTGNNGVRGAYPEHVDLQTYIEVDGKIVNVSPNAIQQQLIEPVRNQIQDGLTTIIQWGTGLPRNLIDKMWEPRSQPRQNQRSQIQIENNGQPIGSNSPTPDLRQLQETYKHYAELVRPTLATGATPLNQDQAIAYALSRSGYTPDQRAQIIAAGSDNIPGNRTQAHAYVQQTANWPGQRTQQPVLTAQRQQ
jgi:hypothetical protein